MTAAQAEATRIASLPSPVEVTTIIKWAADDDAIGKRERAAFWTRVACYLIGDAPVEGAVFVGLVRVYGDPRVGSTS